MKVDGKSILQQAVLQSASGEASCTVVLNQDEEHSDYKARQLVDTLVQVRSSVVAPTASQGALVSALFGADGLEANLPLLISPGDAFLKGHFETHLESMVGEFDALTISFRSTNPRWSFIEVSSDDYVAEVAEKRVISELATTGHFYFKRTSDFLQAAEWVLVNNAKTDGRFFVSTALNFLVSEGLKVRHREISRNEYFSYSKPHDFIEQAD